MSGNLIMFVVTVAVLALGVLIFTRMQEKKDEGLIAGVTPVSPPEKPAQTNHEVVLFYADWCGNCTTFHPTWDELQKSIVGANLIKVDCDAQKELAQEHGVSALPCIRVYPVNGEMVQYSGDRSYDDVKRFIEMHI